MEGSRSRFSLSMKEAARISHGAVVLGGAQSLLTGTCEGWGGCSGGGGEGLWGHSLA